MTVQNESPILPFAYGHRPADIALLAKHSFLAHIGPQDLGAFVELLEQVAVTAGTDVFRQGDEGEHMYFVLEGEAHMRRGASEVARLGPGDPFGEVAILGPQARTETVRADTVLRLARLSRSRFASLGVSPHCLGSRPGAENGDLAELIARSETRDLDRTATHARLALEDEIHVLPLVALAEDDRPRGHRDLIEELDERAEILWPNVREEAVLRE